MDPALASSSWLAASRAGREEAGPRRSGRTPGPQAARLRAPAWTPLPVGRASLLPLGIMGDDEILMVQL